MKFIWGLNWAKTEKQRKRYQQYKGEDMHFFVGEIIKFNEQTKKEEDFWVEKRLFPIKKLIEIIESGRPFGEEIKEYRETQLKFLREIQNGKI